MKLAMMVVALLLLAPATASAATTGGDPPDQERNGWFSPTFTDSPVNLVLCTVPDACHF